MKDVSPPITASLGFGLVPKEKTPRKRGDDDAPVVGRKAKILVVDGDTTLQRLTTTRLGLGGYAVECANDAESALDMCVRSRPNLVISDLRLPQMDGLSLLKELKSRWPSITVIIMTAHGTIREAVEATQNGAFGFLVKPVDKAELLGQVQRAIAASTFTLVEGNWRADIVSRSQLMEDRLGLANKAAASSAPVLLTGENGTGKELLARAIHAASARRDRTFTTASCRGSDETELETRLFGAEGAATSLAELPSGAFAEARGGTLLLDEIGDLPPRLQGRLNQVMRLNPDRLDVRLICTTSRDLKSLVDAGEFRQDLYYQINVLPIEIPPLGRRREDIPLLVSHFLEQATEEGGRKKIYTPKAIELLATTDWPGNVRQLFELVKHNVAITHGKVITEDIVQKSLGKEVAKTPTYHEAREQFSRAYLEKNLQETSGNVTESARLAKRNRTDFYKLLARYRIQPDDFKTGAGKGDPPPDAAVRTGSS